LTVYAERTPSIATRLLQAGEPDAIIATAVALQNGRLVVLPTDTVYGVAADAHNQAAILQLYAVKQRPLSKAIPILLADPERLDDVAREVPPAARALMARFWPGPLTLVVPKRPDLPPALSPDANIAVRIPDCAWARAVIRAAGGAVAATSANRSGEPPAQTAAAAQAALGGQVAIVLDGGPAPRGLASTVVDCTGAALRILRAGPLTRDDLAANGIEIL
jgi:L-threonylcarbamoyladenylate synthase